MTTSPWLTADLTPTERGRCDRSAAGETALLTIDVSTRAERAAVLAAIDELDFEVSEFHGDDPPDGGWRRVVGGLISVVAALVTLPMTVGRRRPALYRLDRRR